MRIAILSDIHGNLDALRAVVKDFRERGVDGAVCLGDIVGYGADPNGCCDLVREVANVSLLGNHDAAVIGVMDTDFYYPAAKQAIVWTRAVLSEESFRWLYSLPYTHEIEHSKANIGFYHSAPILPSGFYYVVREDDAKAHMRMIDRLPPYAFIGHSHLTTQYRVTPRGTRDLTGKTILGLPAEDERYIINVGSVGQPRDHDPRACYGILDTASGRFDHLRVEYDIERAAAKIREAGLERKFADRLFSGT